MISCKSIIHATDFSQNAEHAFRIACELASESEAKLIALHVAQMPVYTDVTAVTYPSPPDLSEFADQLQRQLRSLVSPIPGVELDYQLEFGDIAEKLDQVARQHNCDLIVLGTSERKGFARLLLGSITEEATRAVHCPILIVKNPVFD